MPKHLKAVTVMTLTKETKNMVSYDSKDEGGMPNVYVPKRFFGEGDGGYPPVIEVEVRIATAQ